MALIDRRLTAMKFYFSTITLLLLCILTGKSLAQNLQPEEYSWDNPEFRERFVGSYGVLSDVEPRLTSEEQTFLRETVLPLLQENPQEAGSIVAAKLSESTSPALYFILGNILLEQNQIDPARQNLQRALSLFPDFRRAHRSMALLEVRANNYSQSIPHWIKVIQLGGGDDQSYGLLGYAYLQEGDWTPAARAFENAILYRPESRDLRRGLVHSLIQSNQSEEAAEMVQKLLDEDPEDPQLWRLLANFYLEEENLPQTAAALEVAVRIAEPTPDTLFLLGGVYTSLGLPQKALSAYERVLQLPSNNIDFEEAFRPVEILLQQRLWEEAIRYSGLLRSHYGRDLNSEQSNRINAAIATSRLYVNPTPQIAETAQAYTEVFPLDGLLHLALGDYLSKNDQIEEALLAYRRSAATEEFQYEAKLRLANLLVTEERYDEAIRLLRELQEIQYNNRVATFLARLEELQLSSGS
ncbi:tetratricopeptide (TPR) repeat protein [Puniceicoccus vermicola]|uniref:Tetratricopeptide repeat protein n=2 Tax=Puniceicoccus vermicola TaxID=388746 RepID=A0A7X1B1A8_9BACT|nr:tetratricopeptide repeat protein [Puniceicoccus vermicola]MBC2603639.1 tetratricopeptide repeat protein [Puniceicoccus vermicola]